jgi:hypothetical protein
VHLVGFYLLLFGILFTVVNVKVALSWAAFTYFDVSKKYAPYMFRIHVSCVHLQQRDQKLGLLCLAQLGVNTENNPFLTL